MRVVKAGVTSFSKRGCIDSTGEEHEVDIIICATGFNTSYIPRFPILGLNGLSLGDVWKQAPASYLGLGVAGFPNFMMMLGPYTPVANGPTIVGIGTFSKYQLDEPILMANQKHKPTTLSA